NHTFCRCQSVFVDVNSRMKTRCDEVNLRNSELRSFQRRLSEFEARGVRVVGISVDPPEINRRQSQKRGYTFPLLSDPKMHVIRRYDVQHPGAGPKGADIARPAEFLLDS